MARKKNAPPWRAAFLRALARTGNVRAAAGMAGVDHSTAYLARRADVGFAGKWEGAVERARDKPSTQPSPAGGRGSKAGGGEELVVRVSKKHGAQLVKASAGRWSAGRERRFLAALVHSGCVRTAAQGCGLSATALYNRKKHYPGFAASWRAAEAEAGERVPALLAAAAIASLDPDVDESELPPVSIGEAIHICRMKGFGLARGAAVPEEPIEQVRARVLARLDAIEAAEGSGEA